ncbi:hypothetical protein [Aliiglaciecola sp. LCG003]|uniref:hypothetical protein n=1 Tax=Aliiglaciecola sp. LCG003 TaxID=3053655 RepID=UPI002572F60C|nr:hypothetical protein [Aliiglaciecola sp. LCG003]WJG11085.1 hypothetical protein QR722_08680 [Aliiglaciecola sp. LCG003]
MNTTPLSRLFNRQQPKVKQSARKAALIKTFADDDLALFVSLIKKWLEQDLQKQRDKPSNS